MSTDPIRLRAQQVQDIQTRLSDWATQLPMPPDPAPDRHHIGYQEFGLSFHHSLSIVSLIERHGPELAASAFALVRPMYETLLRGWWFTTCATDEQASRFTQDDEFVGGSLPTVSAAVDARSPFTGTNFFTRFAQGEWNLCHSFTHGGREALAVYGHRPGLDPDFDPDLILAALDNAARMSAVATMGMCHVCHPYAPDAVAPIYEQLMSIAPELVTP